MKIGKCTLNFYFEQTENDQYTMYWKWFVHYNISNLYSFDCIYM